MKNLTKILIVFVFFLALSIPITLAANVSSDFIPSGNINMKGRYNITNLTKIQGTILLLNVTGINVSYLKSANCDVKADATTGALSCGTDATGSGFTSGGNINASYINVTKNLTVAGLISCDTIDTDANGMFTCGNDGGGGGGGNAFVYANISEFFGESINGTVLRVSNMTNIRNGAFNFANNLSALLNNATINRSISLDSYNKSISLVNYNQSISLVSYNQSISLVNYNQSVSLDNYLTSLSTFFSSLFNLGNLTSWLGGANTTLVRFNNLSMYLTNNSPDVQFKNVTVVSLQLGWSNLTNYPSACPAGTYLTTVDDSTTCVAADTSATDDFNYASNLTGILGDNSSIIRTQNLTQTNFLVSNSSATSYINCNRIQFTSGMGSAGICDGDDSSGAGSAVSGSGSTNNLTRWESGSTLGNSSIYDTGINIGIGISTPTEKLVVVGNVNITGKLYVLGDLIIGTGQPELNISTANGVTKINTSVNVSRDLYIPTLGSQSCIGTDASGKAQAGSCGGGSGTVFNYANISEFFGEQINGSVLRTSNMSNIRQGAWILANFSTAFGNRLAELTNAQNVTGWVQNSTINRSISLDTYNKSISLDLYNQSISLNSYYNTIGVGSPDTSSLDDFNYANNFSSIIVNSSILTNANMSTFLTLTTLDNNTLLRIGNITNIRESLYNLANFTSNYALRLGEQFNFANNLTGILGPNSSILRTANITNIREGNYQLSNFTTNFANRLGEMWILINLTNFFGDSAINSSILRVTNITNIREGAFNYINLSTLNKYSNFQLANVSNNTLTRGDNLTTALWNITSTGNIIARDFTLDTVTVQKFNVTNITVNNWTTGASVVAGFNIFANGSGICIGGC